MKRLYSAITVGCLVSTLIFSSASNAFAMEEAEEKVSVSTETGSASGEIGAPVETEAPVESTADTSTGSECCLAH